MTDNATPPKRPGRPARGPKFPAALPRTMTPDAMRECVDDYADRHGFTLGEAVRELVSEGLVAKGYGTD